MQKRHTLEQARAAKRDVRAATAGVDGVSVGIRETESGDDYAIVVFVENEDTRRHLPSLSADLPIEITVSGAAKAY